MNDRGHVHARPARAARGGLEITALVLCLLQGIGAVGGGLALMGGPLAWSRKSGPLHPPPGLAR